MTKDLAWLAKMTASLPKDLQAAQRRGVSKGALHVTRAMRDEVRAATGGDMKLSGGPGRKPKRVGAKYTVKGTTNPSAVVKATGPAQLIERDTKAHKIAPRRRRGQAKARALRLADGRFAASVQHPGTRGKRPYEKGYLRSRDATGPIFDREVQAAIGKALK